MDDDASDINMKVIEPNLVTKEKTKVGVKGKKKVAKPKADLQDVIMENRKEALNLAIGVRR